MPQNIPTYPLNNLADDAGNRLDVLFLNYQVKSRKWPIDVPHRTGYYGIGVCTAGSAGIKVNLDSYEITPGSLVLMAPPSIKEWTHISTDFETRAILFTKGFARDINLDKFPFFDNNARHIFHLQSDRAEALITFIYLLHQKFSSEDLYRLETTNALLQALLFDAASVYEVHNAQVLASQSRGQLMAVSFKKLVNEFATKERTVKFYADQLFITSGHLTEIVKDVTGQTPHEWIVQAVILEAKILLQNHSLSIVQIADLLHFNDPSTFGKFFKNITRQSPLAYRQSR